MKNSNITFKERFLVFDTPETQNIIESTTETAERDNSKEIVKAMSGKMVEGMTETPKSGSLHAELLSKLQAAEKENGSAEKIQEYKQELKKAGVSNVRYSRVFNKDHESDSPATRIENTKVEMEKRLLAYTSKRDQDWFEIDYKAVGGMGHELKIGLGDILVDPDVTDILIQKKDNPPIKAHRGISAKGRVGFLDENDKYVSTFTGDKFKILTNKEELISAKEPQTYIASLQNENNNRQEHRISYEASMNYSETSIYDILKNTGIDKFQNPDKLTNQEIVDTFQNMSADELTNVLNKVSSLGLKYLFTTTGISNYRNKSGLVSEIDSQIDSLSNKDPLVQAFGSKEELKSALKKLSAHESAGFRPFNLSSSGCAGFFQFTMGNINKLKTNPFNPNSAVEGQLKLMQANYNAGCTNKQELLIAHNRGARFVTKNRGKFEQDNGDEYGNPNALKFVAAVENQNIDKYSDEDQKIELADNITILNPISAPFERNPETGTTLCSATAAKNLKMLGVDNPIKGNAIDVQNSYANDTSATKLEGTNTEIATALKQTDKKVADILVSSDTEMGKIYGHRAVAYKSASGEWKILDPYLPPNIRTGIPFDKYTGKINFAVPLDIA